MPVILCDQHGATGARLVSARVRAAYMGTHILERGSIKAIRAIPFVLVGIATYWADTKTIERFGVPTSTVLSLDEYERFFDFFGSLEPVCNKCFDGWLGQLEESEK